MVKRIIGNWKMHGNAADAVAMLVALSPLSPLAEIVLCPPATLLHEMSLLAQKTGIKTGGQDCHYRAKGAHTGDISAGMLKAAGADYVIVGHSERRQGHAESNEIVMKKAAAARAAGLKPVICIGESEAQQQAGQTLDVLAAQLTASLPPVDGEEIIVAYEPIWAIGAGKTPSVSEIALVHRHIRAILTRNLAWSDGAVSVLYGGSVKPDNADEILSLAEVSGALVGGASLDASSFGAIIRAAVKQVG